MTDPRETLAAGARRILGRPLTSEEAGLFDNYLNLLVKWQKTQRLVGSVEPGWIVERLLLDSLLFLRVLGESARRILDLGSGAGFPGIPLKIVRRDLALTLVESRRRRASFLSSVVRELGLEGVTVINARVEERIDALEGRFDAVVMRCAGDFARLLPLAARLVAPGGVVVASGPPIGQPPRAGEVVSVAGVYPDRLRQFLIHKRS